MKLLVISTLKWRMNPLTPISFLDHIVRRLGLTDHVHWDFFKKYEVMILCVVSVLRFVCYKRSVLGIATMLHVVDEIDPPNCIDYKSQLLDFLKTTKVCLLFLMFHVQLSCPIVQHLFQQMVAKVRCWRKVTLNTLLHLCWLLCLKHVLYVFMHALMYSDRFSLLCWSLGYTLKTIMYLCTSNNYFFPLHDTSNKNDI